MYRSIIYSYKRTTDNQFIYWFSLSDSCRQSTKLCWTTNRYNNIGISKIKAFLVAKFYDNINQNVARNMALFYFDQWDHSFDKDATSLSLTQFVNSEILVLNSLFPEINFIKYRKNILTYLNLPIFNQNIM